MCRKLDLQRGGENMGFCGTSSSTGGAAKNSMLFRCRSPLPSARRPSFHTSTPAGSFVCCWMQCLVVSDLRRGEHPQLRFAPCCCSSTELVCEWVKRCGFVSLIWISTTV